MIWITYILLESILHWYWIEKKKSVPHYVAVFLWRGMVAACYGAFFMDLEPNLLELLNWLLTVILPFPFVFNYALHWFLNKPIGYAGKESGWIDSWVAEHKQERVYFLMTVLMAMVWVKYFL